MWGAWGAGPDFRPTGPRSAGAGGPAPPTRPEAGRDAASARPTPTLEEVTRRLGREPRVLVAEDDHDLRIALVELLSADGYDVRSVANGAELMDVIGRAFLFEQDEPKPDVIVSDIRMPGFNGLHTMESLRRLGHDVAIVVITAFGDEDIRHRVERLGGSAFFHKPLDIEELEEAIRGLLEGS